ncbi:hypothetical protein ACS0TY_007490 [Phlomoides rotata]
MESGGSSKFGLSKKGKKTDRNRRAWTLVEEIVFIGLMKDLVANGWKMENGFKPGYLLKLEAGMLKSLSGTDNRASPHITSRITIWKKIHVSMNIDDMNTILNNVLLILKADPNTTNMCFKTWPLYDDWNEIFGMDRVNDRAAEDVVDDVNGIRNENAPGLGDHVGDPTDHVPVETPADMDFVSESPTVDNSTATKVCGKKRSAGESSTADRLCDVIGQFCRTSDNRFNNLVQVIGYESTLGGARKELPKVWAGIPELTKDERIDVAHIFAKNADCLEMFLGMADESRTRYVHRLLDGNLKCNLL